MRSSYRFPNIPLAALMAAALLSPMAFADAPSPDAKPAAGTSSSSKATAKPKDAATPKASDGKTAAKDAAGKATAGTSTKASGASATASGGSAKISPTASTKTSTKTSAKKDDKPAGPDNLTPPTIRHVVTCPNPKISPCVMKKPVLNGYRLLTSGIEIQDVGTDWIVDFGKGARPARLLFQVYEQGGGVHDIDVSFFTKAGMQKPPSPIE